MNKTKSYFPLDHIFGDLDQSLNSSKWLAQRLAGLHHYHVIDPENPRPGQITTIYATTSADRLYHLLTLWYTTDDWQTVVELPFIKGQLKWSSTLWTYLRQWTVDLPSQPEGTILRYRIGAKSEAKEDWIFADNQSAELSQATNFAIWYGFATLPEWARDAMVYQIFVDRFNPGGGKDWLQTGNVHQPFGGTLRGVIEKLDYINDMGFNAIWLTPIFESPTHHGYDIVDYFQINPRIGNLSDFRELINQAHARNMRVIMDLVLNHCSNQHPYFIDALGDVKSSYHDWFVWRKWPEYECFYDVPTMPKINLQYGSPAREYFLSVATYWLDFGVDGFRLDYANGPEQDFWIDFRRTCSQTKKDVWTFGEVVAPPDVQKTYANGLNGTLDFLLCQALRLTFAQRIWPLSRFAAFITSHFNYFPHDFSQPAFIDNHDMNRFLFSTGNDEQMLKIALLVLYSLPGAPIIYYGTELELSQVRSIHEKGAKGFDEARLAMPWEETKKSVLPQFIKRLSQIRQNNPNICLKEWQTHQCSDENETLVMSKEGDRYFLIINRSDMRRSLGLVIKQKGRYKDLLSGELFDVENGNLNLQLDPTSALILILD
jgi:glycosidase